MEFGVVIFLLSSSLLGHASGFTTPDYDASLAPFESTIDPVSWPPGSCSGHFTAPGGEFSSPNYPSRYPHYAHCTWTIQSRNQKFIILRFSYVDIEMSSGCRYDAVNVYDGPSSSSPLLGRMCGSQLRSFHSTGNILTVQFSSDANVNGGGFVARWDFSDSPGTTPPAYETTPLWETTPVETETGSYETTTAYETTPPSESATAYFSCRNSCGVHFGRCSCDIFCQYRGTCCHDFYDYCSPTTESATTEVFLPTTAAYSCMNNCGYNFGACSCQSSCLYYGNCCHDYYNYCFSTTEQPATTTVETPIVDYISCRDRCGYDGGICSCTSSCQYSGHCCHDYYYYCAPTTDSATTTDAFLTTADYSCMNNCGYNFGACSCQSSCLYYGNCCHDYYNYCFSTTEQPATTTVKTLTEDYISCRDRCGYDGGICSCTSSCQYSGHCCHDYYYYCAPTTDSATTTDAFSTTAVAAYSCMNNCGYNFGACSCQSSCLYYGNCCHDYYNYCSNTTATPTPGSACGGILTQQQGQFFSPNYPNNYPNNARCTWTLMAGELQVVSLTFTFVNLELCCDSIHVYDGPNNSSTILGSATVNGVSFNSSSRYMMVVFSTDSSVTARGFQAEWTFKSAPMCKNRCGTSNSRCSCQSSCQRYGRCCHDYHEYCDYVTSPPLPACGGNYYGSGSISSPYYPGYYHDNAQCVWRLSAPAGQTIFLSFQDLDLERCCNCDYVNVYDGSSTTSPLIGKLCHNTTSHLDFQSTSSYMTVLFRSDYSGVGRGFKAYFSSSLNQNTGRVDCSSERMNIAIRKSYLDSMGFNWQDLYLDDHRCRASTDYSYVTFNFPLQSCSTKRKTQNGRIIYTNNVRAAQSMSGEITRRDTHFLMFVSCVMERDSSVGTLYEAKEITNATISGTGRFNTTMAFYPSSSFSYPITEFPYRVNLNQELYVQVQLTRAEPSLHLFIDSCVASPNHDFTIRTYDLIRNGCQRDSTVYIYRNGNRYFAQFRFSAFKFLRTHSQVFLRCDLIICADNDYNSRCRQGCRNRRKRSLSSDHHTEVVTLGPITLKGPEEAEAKAQEEE
ncbi:deleted in malignant brain tumors 1 protein-like isoform X2 [Silurus meridionalis]|uniref:deleted in malignant brain tumors 1 protein-like isoform X2 n=1 Tax=Silurus meridionalis TaxID=175797 RepID=UPI001EEB6E51|nr:deleted in malignant brain tumors 1 protein-like isoform X2 [Silurus meridionalis]